MTLNEEVNLPRCVDSVSWCDDVIVFDSLSTDRTAEIARAAGARVLQHRFRDYGSQREAARTTSSFRHPWILMLDADETVDGGLAAEVREIAGSEATPHVAYRMRRKDHFMGKWIRHSTLYPSWFVRFFRHERVRYEPRAVHEYPTVDGSVGELKGHLHHHSFAKGFREWLGKHSRYAALEAEAEHAILRSGGPGARGIFSLDPVRRRRALKGLSFRLPARPLLRFAYMYLFRLGLLDGWPGFRYCRLMASYERMIVDNIRLLRAEEAERGRRAQGSAGPGPNETTG
ncbi:MAG: glycosyltransferase family 2 protein [Planctomycetota bacterium]|jgi:glycosyltransferase involved in cell wall biosynthesis